MENAKVAEERRKLQTLESELKYLIGMSPTDFYVMYDKFDFETKERIVSLVKDRQCILNRMFRRTPQEIAHLKVVNDLLLDLTEQMYRRTADLYRSLLQMKKVDSFDDDYEINGKLSFSYNGDESVLQLEDDACYGSDFSYMIGIADVVVCKSHHYCEHLEQFHIVYNPSHTPDITDEQLEATSFMNDGMTWGEGVLRIPELQDVVICYALHDLYDHKPYSIPDVLRMNDFWVEAGLLCQHFVEQDGARRRFF